MDKTRIHLLPDEPLMKLNHDARKNEWRKLQSLRNAELNETASQAKGRGLDYFKVLSAARNGDKKALAKFFSLAEFMDGAAAEGYFPDASALFHLVGDKTFSNFVRGLPLADQVGVRGTLIGGMSEEEFANGADVDYLQRYCPETTKLLFRGEIVDWTSPDGRYSIRKTFTDPLELSDSKVSHAELIEKGTSQVLCDLTDADIGAGGDRDQTKLTPEIFSALQRLLHKGHKQRFTRVQANRLRKLICRSTSRPAKRATPKSEAQLWATNL